MAKASSSSSSTPALALAIIMGAFLSGAMTSLSLITIPLLLESIQPAQILHQWVRLYDYGHLLLPSMSLATLALYGYVALSKRAAGAPWRRYAVAGAVTVGMIPFTLIVMLPTNNALFGLDEDVKRASVAGAGLDSVRGLVGRWGWMHLVRSGFPLVGAVLGLNAGYEDLAGI